MAKHTNSSWIDYMSHVSNKEYLLKDLQLEGLEKLVNSRQQAFTIFNHSVPMVYVLDYTTGKYLIVSDQCMSLVDFPSKKMLDGGVGFVLDRYHPADFKLFNDQMFPERQQILSTIPIQLQQDYIFSYSYRIKNAKGNYVNLLQRNSFIKSDEHGNPLLSLGLVISVNHIREDSPVIQLVEKVNGENGSIETISKSTFYLKEEDRIFTKREKEILPYLAEGLTSKEIADKLFMSEHTVINHKRNMQLKSNSQNTVALISFAFRNHLL